MKMKISLHKKDSHPLMDLNYLNNELIKDKLLHKIIYFDELDSTNNYAKRNALETDTLIITSYQTNGRGRFNRIWETSRGKNLTFSLVKHFKLGIDEIHLINFYSSYILSYTLKQYLISFGHLEISLKWPNDILLNGKKIAGFLSDVKDLKGDLKKFIIGIGININQKEFNSDIIYKATSLSTETNVETSVEFVLIDFIKNFYSQLYYLNMRDALMQNWIMNSKIMGKKVNFKMVDDDIEKEATVIDIDQDGALSLMFSDGNKSKFYSGEISLIYN